MGHERDVGHKSRKRVLSFRKVAARHNVEGVGHLPWSFFFPVTEPKRHRPRSTVGLS